MAAFVTAAVLAVDLYAADSGMRVTDVPYLGYPATTAPTGPPLHRTADLLQLLWRGEGTFSGASHGAGPLELGVSVHPVPWRAPNAASLTLRRLSNVAEESTLSLRLGASEGWCTPELELAPGSRLRLEALQVEHGRKARLRVTWRGAAGPPWEAVEDAGRASETAARAMDRPLPDGRGTLCLRAEGGAISVGEPRVVAPEPPDSDTRPRFIVLLILDALRADIMAREDLGSLAPALAALAARGLHYQQAVSPGGHTQAALWPMLAGRDLARIDPVRARRFTPNGTSLDLLFSRPNLAVSHLAQRAGYHPVFLGNNSFLIDTPFFARLTNRGSPQTGTIDTIAALPALFARYADERVFLVYYLSTPHGFSSTPRRLAERLGCASLSGMEAERCLYEARVAHADEAVEALQRGLAASGLTGRTLQVLAADHGEVFGDGRPVETRLFDRWWSLDQGHGGATHWNEIHVPLVLAGPGVEPGVWSGRVSTLDVLPTLASLMRLDPPQKLDGQALPPFGPARAEAHRFVTQGYCSHSVLEGWTQLVWWEAECAERRELGSGRQLTHRAELWERGALVATDESDPARVAGPLREHLEWLAARLPGEAWLVDASGIAPARLRVKALEGFITDYGPGDGPASLGSFKATLRDDGRELLLEFDRAPGPVVVATWPPAARVRFDVEPFGAQAFVGRLQLPLALLARAVDPSQRPDLWLAAAEPARPVASGRHLRIWRQAYRKEQKAGPRSVTELDRVLREWGYIR